MNYLTLPLFLSVIFAFCVIGYSGASHDKIIQTYFKYLDEHIEYDKRTAPDGNGGKGAPVRIIASMYILDVNVVDDSNMDYNAQFYFRQTWNDSRLQHPHDVDDITIRDMDRIWTPDLFFTEERKGSLHQVLNPNVFIKIKPNGEVRYSVKLSVTFSCPMDLQNFPHDIQKCKINAESYGFQRKHISLEWKKPDGMYFPVSFSKNMTMLDFDLIEAIPSVRNMSFTFGDYSSLQIDLKFKRKFGFFAIRLYVPFIILVLMSSFSLWIKAQERCLRLSLLLVILYLMVTISSEVNRLIPPAPYTKASDVWIGVCESLVFAVFLEFLVVALITEKKLEDNTSKGKGDIVLSLDPEGKENNLSSDSLKSPLSKLINMFDARNGGKGRRNALSDRIDRICRVVFPLLFIIFNIIYWSVYCTA